MRELFDVEGFVVVRKVVENAVCTAMLANLAVAEAAEQEYVRKDATFAMRDVFATAPQLFTMAAEGPLAELARTLAGRNARPTKATFFDKRPEANWSLPLHQDLTITVANRAEVAGYAHWSVKSGIVHVQPPLTVMEQIVALRLHLDECPAENGALEVVPGSHRLGRLAPRDLQALHSAGRTVVCPASAGDVLAMRPLLVHGSSKARIPARRRVLHIEYCAGELDPPLKWPRW